jgi:hypothetical protein
VKQKPSAKIFFSLSIVIALLFSMGVFLNFPLVIASEAKQSRDSNYIESEVVAKMAPDANADAIATKYNLTVELLKSSSGGNLFIFKSKKNLSTKKMIAVLKKDPAITSVQPNFKYQLLSRTPNDQLFFREWALANTESVAGGISASSAWDLEAKNQSKIAIAVIDTGISSKQSELSKSITGGKTKGRNIMNPKKKPDDSDGHGTFLAGIIAAQTNNKKGIAGSSFFGNLKIMPLKFDFTTDQAISAINYAKAKSVPIINASWGSYGEEGLDLVLKDTIAAFPGVFVTASGNGNTKTGQGYDHDGEDPNQKMYPCDFDLANIICVAASAKDGSLAEYSDYGALSVDVAAPGGTDDDPIFGLGLKKNKYTQEEGSSLSAAFVSAEAGLIMSKKPGLSSTQVIEIIKSSVDLEPSMTGKSVSGGKVNFQKALQMAENY